MVCVYVGRARSPGNGGALATRAWRASEQGGGVTAREWDALVAASGGRCFYCGVLCGRLEMDHVQPLRPRNGGEPGQHEMANVVPACADCNHGSGGKFNRSIREWYGPLAGRLRRKHLRLLARARSAT